MSLDADSFRAVLGRFASGITVLTTRDESDRDCGMTVSAFASLSLEPPLVLACVDRQASMHELLMHATTFAVNILSSAQEPLSRRFADPDSHWRFDGVGFRRGHSGSALLEDALAHLECRVVQRIEGGDHTIVVGEVERASATERRPLLYYRGGYAQLER